MLSGTPSTLIALGRGEDVLASTEAVGAVLLPAASRYRRVGVAAVAHLAISLFWARVLQRVLREDTQPSAIVAAGQVVKGAGCGGAIALVDLGLIGRLLPPIRELDGGPLLADHIAFGVIVGWVLHRAI